MLVAPARPASYFFLLFDFGPGFNVPLNFRASSMCAFVHRRMVFLPTGSGFGATTRPSVIQECRVWRETPIFAAASTVV